MVTPGDKIGIVGGNGKGKPLGSPYRSAVHVLDLVAQASGRRERCVSWLPRAPDAFRMVFRSSTCSFTSLQSYVEPELLRGVPLHICLSGWGKHWKQTEGGMFSASAESKSSGVEA